MFKETKYMFSVKSFDILLLKNIYKYLKALDGSQPCFKK